MEFTVKQREHFTARGYREVLYINLLDSKKEVFPWLYDGAHIWIQHLPEVDNYQLVDFKTLKKVIKALGISEEYFRTPKNKDLMAIAFEDLRLFKSSKETFEDDATIPKHVFAKVESSGVLSLIAVFDDEQEAASSIKYEESTHSGAFDIVWIDKAVINQIPDCNPVQGDQPTNRVA